MGPSAMNGLTVKEAAFLNQLLLLLLLLVMKLNQIKSLILLEPRTELCLRSEGNLAKIIIETSSQETPTTS